MYIHRYTHIVMKDMFPWFKPNDTTMHMRTEFVSLHNRALSSDLVSRALCKPSHIYVQGAATTIGPWSAALMHIGLVLIGSRCLHNGRLDLEGWVC